MRRNWKRAVGGLLVLVLLVPLSFGCGEEEEKEERTITIGFLTDFTGPGGPAIFPLYQSIEDLVKYYNEEGRIPGAKLRLVSYDTRMDPARYVPGYDWCRERGADLILTSLPGGSETIKPYAEKDRIPIVTYLYSEAAMEPPGWVFVISIPSKPEVKTLLKWVSENHWDDTQRIPKIGYYDWMQPEGIEIDAAIEEYCQAHPDEFDYVGASLTPVGTMSCGGEVEKLKDCDYIYAKNIQGSYFIKGYRDKGYDAQLLGGCSSFGFYEFLQESVGWENLDGYITTMIASWWGEENAAVAFIKEFIDRYHPGASPEDMGGSYYGGFLEGLSLFEVLRQAVEEVGIENFDGQAFCDTAVKFSLQLEGSPPLYFTDTERYLVHGCAVYEWSAEAEGMVRLTTDWLPLVME